MHKQRVLMGALVLGASLPAGARPVEAITADQAGIATDLRDVERRAASLSEQIDQRKRVLKQRLRSLYKLAHGGSVRMMVDAGGPEELALRLWAAQRVVHRDLDELAALDEETRELSSEANARSAGSLVATQLEVDRAIAARQPRVGLEKHRGQLPRPVPGAIVVGFARTRVGTSGSAALELPRRAVELTAGAGDPVRAVGDGVVRFASGLDELGNVVVIDHGHRFVTVTGRLGALRVAAGDTVTSGAVLGAAAGGTVTFELSEGRTALDPSAWLRAPIPASSR